MIKALKIEKTNSTPEVVLDKEKKCFYIKGDIMPEDSFRFFEPIFKWFEEYAKSPLDTTVLDITLNIINTSSTRQIILILKELKKIADQGKEVIINLSYPADDELMEYMIYEMSQAFPKIKFIKKLRNEG